MDNIIVDKVKDAILPVLGDMDIELVDITYRKEAGRMVLRLLVDKIVCSLPTGGNGIRLDECSELNHKISQILDYTDIFESRYILEVSSPGLDRCLKSQRDFERAIGKFVRITTSVFIEGKNTWIGLVDNIDSEKVIINTEDNFKVEIPLDNIVKAKLEIKF